MKSLKPDLYIVGEYWAPGFLPLLKKYIDVTEGAISLFDASLHHNLFDASRCGKDYDLTKIFHESLVEEVPELAVTIVDNHDTQPLQALEAPINHWFKPLAYAFILLREKGYPCVFYPDLYGATYIDRGKDGNCHEIVLDKCENLEDLLKARKLYAYGHQKDYFDHPNCVGWVREGNENDDHTGCAIVISNGEDGHKYMELGTKHSNKTFYDFLNNCQETLTLNEKGGATFLTKGGKVSVWCLKEN